MANRSCDMRAGSHSPRLPRRQRDGASSVRRNGIPVAQGLLRDEALCLLQPGLVGPRDDPRGLLVLEARGGDDSAAVREAGGDVTFAVEEVEPVAVAGAGNSSVAWVIASPAARHTRAPRPKSSA